VGIWGYDPNERGCFCYGWRLVCAKPASTDFSSPWPGNPEDWTSSATKNQELLVTVEDEKQSRTVCPSKRAVFMVVRTDSATWNCPTRSRIGVVPVVEGGTEKGDKTCASKKL
jgi:hypothetical protein